MRASFLHLQDFASFSDTGRLELGPINLLVGRNNSGKSAILRALYGMQAGSSLNHRDIHEGASVATITVGLEDVADQTGFGGNPPFAPDATYSYSVSEDAGITRFIAQGESQVSAGEFIATEPACFIYPLFNRRPQSYGEQITLDQTNRVGSDWTNLSARLDRLVSTQNPRAAALVAEMQEVLGVTLTTVASPNGKLPGIFTNASGGIYLDRMGAGIATAVTLLSCLVEAEGKLFLIEEPENDLHPAALRPMLDLIEQLAERNQFVISTHSHVVVRRLGAVPDARIFGVEQPPTQGVPLSSIRHVEILVVQDIGDVRDRAAFLPEDGGNAPTDGVWREAALVLARLVRAVTRARG